MRFFYHFYLNEFPKVFNLRKIVISQRSYGMLVHDLGSLERHYPDEDLHKHQTL